MPFSVSACPWPATASSPASSWPLPAGWASSARPCCSPVTRMPRGPWPSRFTTCTRSRGRRTRNACGGWCWRRCCSPRRPWRSANTSNAGGSAVSLLEFRCHLRYPSGFVLDAAFTTDAPVTALVGLSASGKTSILSVLAGLRRPEAGLIRLGGRVLYDSTAGVCLPPEERRVGYVFQDLLLFPHLSVEGNLLYGWKRRPAGARPIDFRRVVE